MQVNHLFWFSSKASVALMGVLVDGLSAKAGFVCVCFFPQIIASESGLVCQLENLTSS